MAVVQTESLLSFLITLLVHLTRMGSLAGFLDNSKDVSYKWLQLPLLTPINLSATNGSNDPI